MKSNTLFLCPLLLCLLTISHAGSTQDQQAVINRTSLYSGLDLSKREPEYNNRGEPQAVLDGSGVISHPEVFRQESFETVLNPRQQVEFMADLEQGEVILYSWEVNGKIYFDFHAHQEGVNPDNWLLYMEGVDMQSSGSLVAPFTGEHGWYWVNLDSSQVTLKLTVSGYYREIHRIDL